ncbi:MAG: cob(I)yrinic acid a,c-diamide adenosyltransferase [Candidatus Lindowbacteria bacterium]|nr:cob(I)yrinic acid a,c-diamide adenosyltransferase [Candidatus Lindowbacteria bacterium]
MKSFNKKGDGGITSLLFGHRIPKHSLRTEACGVIDEANSALGLARSIVSSEKLKPLILGIQEELFLVGAELAALPNETSRLKTVLSEEHTLRLEKLIEEYEGLIEMPKAFVPPGGTPGAGALDLARSIVRRAERRIAKLFDEREMRNPEMLRYCNRLADLLFTLARYEQGMGEKGTRRRVKDEE